MSGIARRTPVGAHYGLRDWLAQRVTALVLLVFLLVLATSLLMAGRHDYQGWASIFAPQPMKLVTALAFAALCYHAWIGVRDVWMDYVRHTGLRLALFTCTVLWLLYCLAWSVQILWSV
jgi:succinate dehydrogenase / fumarate reductase membrane anchor subunit